MKKIVCIQILLWMSCLINVSAQDSYKEYEQKVYVSSQGDSLQYCLLRPEVEKPGEKYPLVLFLHGAGERGNDNRKQLKHGGQMWLNPVNRKKYPAFILLPQCPAENYWGYEMRPNSLEPFGMPDNPELTTTIRTLKSLLDTFLDMPQVDKLRVYIMGLSMGGMATYDMVIRYPEIFEIRNTLIPNDDIPNLFCSNHYAIYAYKEMSQSGAVKVAFNYYTPVIVSDLPGFKDEVEEDINGYFFKSENIDSLKDVMRKCIDKTTEDYNALVGRMRDNIDRKYSVKALLPKYKAMFSKVLNDE